MVRFGGSLHMHHDEAGSCWLLRTIPYVHRGYVQVFRWSEWDDITKCLPEHQPHMRHCSSRGGGPSMGGCLVW